MYNALMNGTPRWSEQQEAIFNEFKIGKGNVVVRARAGTGKTTTILEGISYAREGKILLAAFNKKIAEELKIKLRNPRADAKTLHSIGYGCVMRNIGKVNLDDERGQKLAFEVIDREYQKTETKPPLQLVVNVKKLASIGKNACPFPVLQDLKDLAYQHDLDPDDGDPWNIEQLATFASKAMDLAATKTNDKVIDFDDMVFLPVRNKWIRGTYDMVVIDEAQDMNTTQLILARGSCKIGGRIFVIGDDRQAIYSFRGADAGSIDRLKTDLKAKELGLTITYRCPKKIVAYAATLVPDYQAAPNAPDGLIDEITFDKIVTEAKQGHFILSRKNSALAKACLKLIRNGVRAMIEGKDIGRGLVALVKKIGGTSIPAFLERLNSWEERQVRRLKTEKGKAAENKLDAVKDSAETLRVVAMECKGIIEFTDKLNSLFTETPNGKGSYVICSTVHKAKGLESDTVFVLRETLYPRKSTDIEEQNIEYVAVTRAKQRLVWVTGIS